MTEDTRLDRIEEKLDKLSEAVVCLARMEERLITIFINFLLSLSLSILLLPGPVLSHRPDIQAPEFASTCFFPFSFSHLLCFSLKFTSTQQLEH